MSYPTGTPSDSMNTNSIWSSGVYTPNDIVARIRDNKTNVDKNAMMNSLGYQVSLVQNYINSTRAGTSSIPIEKVYTNKVQASGVLNLNTDNFNDIEVGGNIQMYSDNWIGYYSGNSVQFRPDGYTYDVYIRDNLEISGGFKVNDDAVFASGISVAGTGTFTGPINVSDDSTFGSGVIIADTCKAEFFQTGNDPFDYNEGTFTGTLIPNDESSGNYSDTIKWVRIGDVVTLYIPIMYTNDDGDTSQRYINGIPSEIEPQTNQWIIGRIYGSDTDFNQDWMYGWLYISNTSNSIRIDTIDDTKYQYHGISCTINYLLK